MFARQVNDEIELRLLEEHHVEEFYAWQMRNREHLREWLDWPLDDKYTIEESRGFIKRRLKGFAEGNGFEAGIWHRGALVGEVSIDRIDRTNRVAEMDYSLGADFQGRGIVTASMRALIDYAFDELKLHRVELRCAAENLKSRAVAERLGFTPEGELRESWLIHGRFVGQVVYGMLASEWPAGKVEREGSGQSQNSNLKSEI